MTPNCVYVLFQHGSISVSPLHRTTRTLRNAFVMGNVKLSQRIWKRALGSSMVAVLSPRCSLNGAFRDDLWSHLPYHRPALSRAHLSNQCSLVIDKAQLDHSWCSYGATIFTFSQSSGFQPVINSFTLLFPIQTSICNIFHLLHSPITWGLNLTAKMFNVKQFSHYVNGGPRAFDGDLGVPRKDKVGSHWARGSCATLPDREALNVFSISPHHCKAATLTLLWDLVLSKPVPGSTKSDALLLQKVYFLPNYKETPWSYC